jgi:hypothetical protein
MAIRELTSRCDNYQMVSVLIITRAEKYHSRSAFGPSDQNLNDIDSSLVYSEEDGRAP